jgi:hypothetical protein
LGPIEENPGREVLGEVHKAMNLASLYKQYVTAFEDDFFLPAKKPPGAAYDDIDFIASVRMLGIRPMGSVEFDAEGSVCKKLDETFSLRARQAAQRMIQV